MMWRSERWIRETIRDSFDKVSGVIGASPTRLELGRSQIDALGTYPGARYKGMLVYEAREDDFIAVRR